MNLAAGENPAAQRLPGVRGRLTFGAPLGQRCWFRTGGRADILFYPADAEDLAGFLRACPEDIPVRAIGAGSNLLIRDGGLRGVAVVLGADFSRIVFRDRNIIEAGASLSEQALARAAAVRRLAGFEFLCGIPGTVGGGVRMNSGAYDGEMADIFVSAQALDRRGRSRTLSPGEMEFAYRQTRIDPEMIVLSAQFAGRPADRSAILSRMEEMRRRRAATQPPGPRTGGSTFKNPGGKNPAGPKAWQLIEQAGCRSLTRGGARLCPEHCNFLINAGQASAADLEELGEEIRARVRSKCGEVLEWEIHRLGERAEGGRT